MSRPVPRIAFLVPALLLCGCASVPDGWLFQTKLDLAAHCGRPIAEVEQVFREGELQPRHDGWATHLVLRERQHIRLRFDNGRLDSFEPFFDIPGRFAAASIGRHDCVDRDSAAARSPAGCMAEMRKVYESALRQCRVWQSPEGVRAAGLAVTVERVDCTPRGPTVKFAISNAGRGTVVFRRVVLPWSDDGPNIELDPSVEALELIRWVTLGDGSKATVSLAHGETLTGNLELWSMIPDSQVEFANGLGVVRFDWNVERVHTGSFEVDFGQCPVTRGNVLDLHQ